MDKRGRAGSVLLVLGGLVLGWVLRGEPSPARAESADQATAAFANPAQQRMDMIKELRTLNRLVSEQTRFLQSGQLKVIIELRDAGKTP